MKHALISEDQIKRVQRALKTSKAIACGAKPNAFALGYVDESIEIVESLKPSEPVFFVFRDATKFDERVAGKQIFAERVATKMYDTPLFALEQSK